MALPVSNLVRLQDNRQLQYYEFGDPLGRPLLYCHGGLSSGLDIMFADTTAKKAGVRIIAPNRPGVGQSTYVQNRSVLAWAEDVAELVDKLQIKQFAASGWSAGGQYAMACGYHMPKRVSRLIIIAGCLELSQKQQFDQLNAMDKRYTHYSKKMPYIARMIFRGLWLVAKLSPDYFTKASAKKLAPADSKVLLTESRDNLVYPTVEALASPKGQVEEYNAFVRPWGFELAQIPQPVEVWQGGADNLVPPVWAEQMHRELRRSKLHMVDGLGHFLAHTQIDAILHAIKAAKS